MIISDQNMAGMGGDELLIQLHHKYPEALKIMLTGEANADAVGNVINRGALYRYISKPWDHHDLFMTVADALKCFEQELTIQAQKKTLNFTSNRLESSLAILLATLNATADAILVLDHEDNLIICNEKFKEIWKLQPEDENSFSQNPLAYLNTNLKAGEGLLFHKFNLPSNLPFDLNLNDHRTVECYANSQKLDGKMVGVVLSFRDVTLQRQSEAIMHRKASYDFLTGLPNRMQFNEKLEYIFKTKADQYFALMFLDLDNFKQVNDTHGHAMGDLLIKKTGENLRQCIREVDLVARWGGDEFAILVCDIQDRSTIDHLATCLIKTLQNELTVSKKFSKVTISLGISIYPLDGNDSSTLLERADQALYQAKQKGKNNYCYYSEPDFIRSS